MSDASLSQEENNDPCEQSLCQDEGDDPYYMGMTLIDRTDYFRSEVHTSKTLYLLDEDQSHYHPDLGLTSFFHMKPIRRKDGLEILNRTALYSFVCQPNHKFIEITLPVDGPEFRVYEDSIDLSLGVHDRFYTNRYELAPSGRTYCATDPEISLYLPKPQS